MYRVSPHVISSVRFLFGVSEIANIGRWKIKFDRKATRAVYSGVSLGSSESCGCEDCLNLAAGSTSGVSAGSYGNL